jgi:hypothetical protein
MADPISSLSSPPNSCIDDDGETSAPVTPSQSTVTAQPANQCLPESAGPAETPSGAQGLVEKFSAPSLPKSVALSAAPSSSTPAALSVRTLTASSGAVPGGSYGVAGSLVKADIASGLLKGSNAELGTVSVQYGKDNDVQLVGARATVVVNGGAGYSLSVTADAAVARANLGENNDDGSLGGNIGSGAELVGLEATINTPAGSLTFGQSVSMSLSGSMGVRDVDHDGELEFCAKFSVPLYTIGACVERFW